MRNRQRNFCLSFGRYKRCEACFQRRSPFQRNQCNSSRTTRNATVQMLDAIKSYWTLRWTQQPRFHPLPSNVTRHFVKTTAGDLELLIAEPRTSSLGKAPIFFVHGGNGHAAVWLEWMTHLSETYGARTYAYSLRNHGASFPVPYFKMVWETSFDDLAADLVTAIKEAQNPEAQDLVFVAHSSGVGLAQYVLSEGLVRARGLALVGAVPHFGNVSRSLRDSEIATC